MSRRTSFTQLGPLKGQASKAGKTVNTRRAFMSQPPPARRRIAPIPIAVGGGLSAGLSVPNASSSVGSGEAVRPPDLLSAAVPKNFESKLPGRRINVSIPEKGTLVISFRAVRLESEIESFPI